MSEPATLRHRVRDSLPSPALHAYRRTKRFGREALAVPEYALEVSRQRRRFGTRLNLAIHPDDEMCLVQFGEMSLRARANYFRQSPPNIDEIEAALRPAGRSLATTRSLLDFACGYGRLTRYFAVLLGPGCVTGSDIDPKAVAFVQRRFGVSSFVSVSDPADLHQEQRYDLIFSASLFTHLPIQTWGRWLARLYDLLEPGGALLVSARGEADRERLDAAARAQLVEIEPGFAYWPINETRGRLATSEYGSTFLETGWARRTMSRTLPDARVSHIPSGLWGVQDLWLLERPVTQRAI